MSSVAGSHSGSIARHPKAWRQSGPSGPTIAATRCAPTLMASIGFSLGLLLGWLVALYFSVAGFAYPGMDELASRFNLPGRMYPSVTLGSLVLGPSVVFLFSLLASVYPALRLFRIEPVEAMRAA